MFVLASFTNFIMNLELQNLKKRLCQSQEQDSIEPELLTLVSHILFNSLSVNYSLPIVSNLNPQPVQYRVDIKVLENLLCYKKSPNIKVRGK